MFSTKTRWRWGVLAVACTIGLGSAACAQTIVVSSSGPSARNYPAGKTLAAGSRIVLAAGDTLTVLDSRGTRVLRGPTTTSAEATATAANPSFAALVATQNRRRARTGAIRGEVKPARPANLWDVDTGAGGTVCVADPAAVRLWRPDMQKPVTMTIAPDGGAGVSVAFPIGQNTAAWPATLPIAEGRSYVVSGPGLARPTRLRFTMLAAPVTDPAGTYQALDAKGCTAQKQLLLGAMQNPR